MSPDTAGVSASLTIDELHRIHREARRQAIRDRQIARVVLAMIAVSLGVIAVPGLLR